MNEKCQILTCNLLQSSSLRAKTWIANSEFHVDLDAMNFSHEVELQQYLVGENGGAPTEQQKQNDMQVMDDKIVAFMETYACAVPPDEPKGMSTAYFERVRRKDT
jgi:thiamine-triphosphatase